MSKIFGVLPNHALAYHTDTAHKKPYKFRNNAEMIPISLLANNFKLHLFTYLQSPQLAQQR